MLSPYQQAPNEPLDNFGWIVVASCSATLTSGKSRMKQGDDCRQNGSALRRTLETPHGVTAAICLIMLMWWVARKSMPLLVHRMNMVLFQSATAGAHRENATNLEGALPTLIVPQNVSHPSA